MAVRITRLAAANMAKRHTQIARAVLLAGEVSRLSRQ
jgi:hypothetical protein